MCAHGSPPDVNDWLTADPNKLAWPDLCERDEHTRYEWSQLLDAIRLRHHDNNGDSRCLQVLLKRQALVDC